MEPLEQLYRDRYVGFRNALAPIVGSTDAARDVVQEAFAVALRERRALRRRESLAPWVWQIAFRLALRERGRRVTDELPDDIGLLAPERDPALAEAIRCLPPRRRLVVFLRYFAGFSYAEIAETLAVSEGTVAATLAQAHAELHDTWRRWRDDGRTGQALRGARGPQRRLGLARRAPARPASRPHRGAGRSGGSRRRRGERVRGDRQLGLQLAPSSSDGAD
jgi:RNA polymerase sigma-70 factor (ECF subfamily)